MTSTSKRSVKKACMTCGEDYADGPDKCPFDGTVLTTIATELAPGEVLGGRYEIEGAFASGGMGLIYKAKHQLMNRTVAIKTIHLSLMSGGAALKRFQQEAQAISALNHPNILSVFDFFISDDGQPYLVMDYLQGTNLREVLNTDHRVTLSRALPILIAACSGFQHAHEHGVIHRDIKPANLMLVDFSDNPDFVKIVDFGIAKLLTEEAQSNHLTATGDTFGSPEFMSPEQCRAKIPDARSDIYSLGCVMYVMLTGASPFTSQDPMEIMYKQVHDSPPPPSKVCPEANLPEAVDTLVLKAIQKEPENRFQSMDEMRQALLAISAQLGDSLAQPTTVSSAVVANTQTSNTSDSISATATSTTKVPADTATKSVAIKNQNIAASAAIGLAVVAVIVIAFGVSKQTQTIPSPSTTSKSTTASPEANQAATSPTPAQTAAPASAAAVSSPGVTMPATENVQVQQMQQARSSYDSNLKNGEAEFKARHFPEARLYFTSAHSIAGTFGQTDERYIDSLRWISKCDLATGKYEQAISGLQYVAYAQKRLHGAKSPQVRATEADLQTAKKALKR
ncbi:MAG: serine/threonine-protein kinase [Candidatus Obscuribacterales bacterium]|nr:serine/threonine-protein kinase [Candidatus Obscuribacterales bacterium]